MRAGCEVGRHLVVQLRPSHRVIGDLRAVGRLPLRECVLGELGGCPAAPGSGGSGVSTLSATSSARAGRTPLRPQCRTIAAIAAPAAPRFKKSRRAGWRLPSLFLYDDIAASPPRVSCSIVVDLVYTRVGRIIPLHPRRSSMLSRTTQRAAAKVPRIGSRRRSPSGVARGRG